MVNFMEVQQGGLFWSRFGSSRSSHIIFKLYFIYEIWVALQNMGRNRSMHVIALVDSSTVAPQFPSQTFQHSKLPNQTNHLIQGHPPTVEQCTLISLEFLENRLSVAVSKKPSPCPTNLSGNKDRSYLTWSNWTLSVQCDIIALQRSQRAQPRQSTCQIPKPQFHETVCATMLFLNSHPQFRTLDFPQACCWSSQFGAALLTSHATSGDR